MSVVQTRFSEKKCRIEDGIFFPNDEAILLTGDPRNGYTGSKRGAILSLLEKSPDDWAEMYVNPSFLVQQNDLVISGGSGSWEGEGFIAVTLADSGALVWLLHLNESEEFTSVSHESGYILAVSGKYPERYEWKIPLNRPECLRVITGRAF